MKNTKSHDFFRYLAPIYDTVARIASFGRYDSMRRSLVAQAGINSGDRILDLATGTGYLSEILDGCEIVGADISLHMVNQARKKTDAAFVLSDAHALPFASDSFDATVCSFALHEMGDPKIVISEMFRVVKPGGTVAVMDVVLQSKATKKMLLFVYHVFVEMLTANYMHSDDLMDSFKNADEVMCTASMVGLIAQISGKKK
ncbi:MAG: class I SAM-dependent methyltransferase [Methanosarcinaceae archaeon]|nr:class I SAM-dependent methyltransferase [Methanosarcinaceae archaeon]